MFFMIQDSRLHVPGSYVAENSRLQKCIFFTLKVQEELILQKSDRWWGAVDVFMGVHFYKM